MLNFIVSIHRNFYFFRSDALTRDSLTHLTHKTSVLLTRKRLNANYWEGLHHKCLTSTDSHEFWSGLHGPNAKWSIEAHDQVDGLFERVSQQVVWNEKKRGKYGTQTCFHSVLMRIFPNSFIFRAPAIRPLLEDDIMGNWRSAVLYYISFCSS